MAFVFLAGAAFGLAAGFALGDLAGFLAGAFGLAAGFALVDFAADGAFGLAAGFALVDFAADGFLALLAVLFAAVEDFVTIPWTPDWGARFFQSSFTEAPEAAKQRVTNDFFSGPIQRRNA